MTSESNKKEVKDRKPLKEEKDEDPLTLKDVLGVEIKPFGYTGISPEDCPRKTKRRRKHGDLI